MITSHFDAENAMDQGMQLKTAPSLLRINKIKQSPKGPNGLKVHKVTTI